MGKNILKGDKIGVLLLALITIFAGYMGCTKRFSQNNSKKIKTENKNYSNENYNYYDDYNYDDYDEYYDDNYYNDEYYYDNYNNTSYTYSNNYTNKLSYYDTLAPSVKYNIKDIIDQYEYYNPLKNISAYHDKYGDVTNNIEITYNNLDVNTPGTYSIVYKVCTYKGSSVCKTVTRTVVVRSNNSNQINNYYEKSPVWSNYSSKSCVEGSTQCSTNRITKPTAKDPYSNNTLSVRLISGNVDIYTPGTYVLVYSANTEHNISGTVTKYVTITRNSNNSYNNTTNNYYTSSSKYISNHTSQYYDDGYYRGYLSSNNNSTQTNKYINNYKWTNKVSYTYRCDNKNQYGTDGWSLISTNTSDNHPTYYYNVGGYTGTLNKTGFYCVEGKGCEYDLNKDLGTCTNVGQTKNVYRTWVGLYSGYVYSNQRQTYSGYVYSYR